jgi:ABC-type lipoprotein export system ATPase subunit
MKAWRVRSDEGDVFFKTRALANEYVEQEIEEMRQFTHGPILINYNAIKRVDVPENVHVIQSNVNTASAFMNKRELTESKGSD